MPLREIGRRFGLVDIHQQGDAMIHAVDNVFDGRFDWEGWSQKADRQDNQNGSEIDWQHANL